MTVFFNVLPPNEARRVMLEQVTPLVGQTLIPANEALNRVTAASLAAPHPLPTFRRSTMDGYAVRASDTYGGSDSLPALLRVVGEVSMGEPAAVELHAGQAAVIHTGGELPATADAVVMIENTQPVMASSGGSVLPGEDIEVRRAVAAGENVIQVGEDIQQGDEILPVGHWIRPQDLGALAAMGIVEVAVKPRPRVAIMSTGDEVIPPGQALGPGQVRDVNSYTTAAQTRRAGGEPLIYGIIPDDIEALTRAADRAMEEADVLVFSAGSSVSVRDATAQVISGLGEPGILFHGVAVRPGKPTIGAIVSGKPAFGLPGNPVSAMNLFDLLVVPTIHALLGCHNAPEPAQIRARVARNVAGTPGREDRVAARLVERDGELWAEPIFGKSNLIFTLVRADGTFVIPLDAAGVTAGDWVSLRLF